MKAKEEGDVVFVKLERDDSVVESLTRVCDHFSVKNGLIVWGIGMFRTAEIGFFNGKEYVHRVLDSPGEVVSFHGSIADGEPRFHIHTALAQSDNITRGGHLFNAVVSPLLEIQIQKLRGIELTRKFNEKSGLKELEILRSSIP